MFKRIFHGFVLLAFLAGLLVVTPVTPAYAATLTVNTLADENDHSCVDGDCSLRDAAELAGFGDTIQFSVTGIITLNSALEITESISIEGPGTASLIISQSHPSDEVVSISSTGLTVSISGATIKDGHGFNGGGIYVNGSALTLDNVLVTNNSASSSGGGVGLNNATASLIVTNSVFTNNQVTGVGGIGGAIFATVAQSVSLMNVEFSNNSADLGGAVGLYGVGAPTPMIWDHITVSQNTANDKGGGLYAEFANLTITNSTFWDNTAVNKGGGISLQYATGVFDFSNVTISDNQVTAAGGDGGGIDFSSAPTVNLINATIVNNTAPDSGGGFYDANSAILTIHGSIIGNNTAASGPDCYGGISNGDYNLLKNTSGCVVPPAATNTITGQDPKLNALSYVNGVWLHTLQTNSPAIDAGENGTCASLDQLGTARPVGPHCDMGTYEYASDTGVVTNTNDSGPGSLRFEIQHIPSTGGNVSFDGALAGQTITLTSRIDILSDVTINGSSLSPYVTISGNDAHAIFAVNAGVDASISSVNLVHGLAPGGLGGSDLGGAIYNFGDLSIYYVDFSNNVAKGFGGAIFNNSGATLYVANSTFANNSAADANILTMNGGGAIANNGGDIEIHTSTFNNNSSDGNGGALYLDGGAQRIYTSTFHNNTSNGMLGGAIYTANSGLDLQNSTLTANSVTGVGGIGGGLYNDTTATVRNSTFSGNSAPGGGGAIASDDSLNLYNSILANSTGGVDDCLNDGGTVDNNVHNLIETGISCGIASVTSDPNLGALANNGGPTWTMKLLIGSPAVNAGDAGTCLTEDQRGQSRPSESACEIGAFEVPDSIAPVALSITLANPNPTALQSVAYTVTFSEDVTGVDTTDFSPAMLGISGAAITNVSGSGDTFTVTVDTGTGNGTLGLNLVDNNSIADLSGIPLGGAGVGDGNFTGDIYAVAKTAPVQITPANGATLDNLRPFFDWTDFAGAKGYQIQVSKSPAFNTTLINVSTTGVGNSRYTAVKDLPANTLLHWRVRGKLTATKYTPWSAAFTFTSGNPPGVPVLASPANGLLLTNTVVNLDWSDSTVPSGVTFDHYAIQVDNNLDFSSPEVDKDSPTSNFVVGPMDKNTKYYWRVRAFGTNGHYSAWSLPRNFRIAMDPPTLLSPIGGVTVGSLKPLFNWSDVVGATGYTINVSLSPTFNSFAINVNINTPTSQYTHSVNLQPAKLYYWRVRANGPNGPSAWSAVETFMTP